MSPPGTDDGLFAAKGRATPLEKTLPEEPLPGSQPEPAPVSTNASTAPLPGIFANSPKDDAPQDEAAENAGDLGAEPPPAASLLTIAAQGSAARSRLKACKQEPPPPDGCPDNGLEDCDTPGSEHIPLAKTESTPARAAATEKTVHLPVPVPIKLPSVVEAPENAKTSSYKKAALLAASIAILVAGAIAINVSDTNPPTDIRPEPQPLPVAQLNDGASFTKALPDSTPATGPETDAGPADAAVPDQPKAGIYTVRFGNAGRAVMTGRASPGSELIVLHNRRPLGTVRADNTGSWTFTARVPARIERHEISVAPLRIETTVTVDKPSFVPRPQRRPAIPSQTAAAAYFVQIASLPSAADAGRETKKLVDKLSGAIAADRITVRAATIEKGRVVYRVAINGFKTKDKAIATCGRIRTRNTSCLVMRER